MAMATSAPADDAVVLTNIMPPHPGVPRRVLIALSAVFMVCAVAAVITSSTGEVHMPAEMTEVTALSSEARLKPENAERRDAVVKAESEKVEAGVSAFKTNAALVSTKAFLAGFTCIQRHCTAGQAFESIVKTAALTGVSLALNAVPFIGPLLSGTIGILFGPKVKTLSADQIWDMIKARVDVAIGSAVRASQVEWAGNDLIGIRTTLLGYNALQSDCHSRKAQDLATVAGRLDDLRSQIQVQTWTGRRLLGSSPPPPPPPAPPPGGAGDKAALQRAMLAFLPSVSMLDIAVKAERLEMSWQASCRATNKDACQAAISRANGLKDVIAQYSTYAQTAIGNYVTWIKTAYSVSAVQTRSEKCTARRRCISRQCDCRRTVQYCTCSNQAQGSTFEFAATSYSKRSIRNSKVTAYRCDAAPCASKLASVSTAAASKYQTEVTDPLNKWGAFALALEQKGYCDQAANRGIQGKIERMGLKSFLEAEFNPENKAGSLLQRWVNLDGGVVQTCGTNRIEC